MLQPEVNIDCDGPLANFQKVALDLVFEETGKRYQAEDIKTWEIFETIKDKTLEDRVYARLKSKGECFNLPLTEGAQRGIRNVKEISDITIVTSPFKGAETWVHERELWLEKYFDISHEDVIHTKKKFKVFGHFFVEDRPKHIISWVRRWPTGIGLLWDTPGNRLEKVPVPHIRVHDWDEVYDIVKTWRGHRA